MGFSGLRSLVYKVQSRALCFQRMWAAVSWAKQRRAQQSLGQASWSPRKKEEGKLSWGEGRTLSVGLELSPEVYSIFIYIIHCGATSRIPESPRI